MSSSCSSNSEIQPGQASQDPSYNLALLQASYLHFFRALRGNNPAVAKY